MNVYPFLEKLGGNGIQYTSILVNWKNHSLLRWRKNREIPTREVMNTKLKSSCPNTLFSPHKVKGKVT